MEFFYKFSRILLLVVLACSSAGKIIFDVKTGALAGMNSVPGVLLSVFSYGMFITLTVGFILCIVWVLVNLFAHIVTKR